MNKSPFNIIPKPNKEIHLIPKSNSYKYVYIFIHGLTQSPLDYVKRFGKFNGPIPDTFKIILLCAPVQKNDFVNGYRTTSWFNITVDEDGIIYEDTIDFKQFDISSNFIKKIIHEEAKLLNGDYSKIFVGGFSQGSCLCYDIGLSFEYLLGGITCFCGVPFSHTKINQNNRKNLNIFAVFGCQDHEFPVNFAMKQIKTFIGDNKNLVVKKYEAYGHNIYDDELEDMKQFIKYTITKE